jgi:hypothetical protein
MPTSYQQLHPASRENAHPHAHELALASPVISCLSLSSSLKQFFRAGRSFPEPTQRHPPICTRLPSYCRTSFATSTRSAVLPVCTTISFCSTSHIRSTQPVRAATASTSLHSPITCHGVSSVPLPQEHGTESSLPKRRCSNSLQANGR